MAGETEAAKRELAMLAIVRKRREEAKAKREAEGRKPGWTAHGLPSEEENDNGDDSDEESEEEDEEDKLQTAKALPSATASVNKKKEAALGPPPTVTSTGPAKLKPMDIKKMNGDTLKEHLRERGLDLQGQKKDLMKRLLDFEASKE